MKFTMVIDPETSPNTVGEYLRRAFFDEKEIHSTWSGDHREMGCVDAFDWQKDVEPLEDILQEEVTCPGCQDVLTRTFTLEQVAAHVNDPNHAYKCTCVAEEHWTRGRKAFDNQKSRVSGFPVQSWIECRYYWDGDGTLVFILPDGECLVSYDCKKNHGWKLVDKLEDL